MKSSFAIIGKNVVLLTIVTLTLLSLFKGLFTGQDLLLIQILAGLTYVFLSYIEYNNASYKASIPVERFAYFPGSFFTFRLFKAGIYLMFGLVLFISPSNVTVMYPVCLFVGATEILITLVKYYKKYCFVNIYSNYILIAQDSIKKVFAQELEQLEYRHEIFYLVKKDGKTLTIKTFSIERKEVFMEKMKNWINNNKIYLMPETRENLNLQ